MINNLAYATYNLTIILKVIMSKGGLNGWLKSVQGFKRRYSRLVTVE